MDVDSLVNAVQTFNGPDALRVRYTPEQWRTFSQYLTPHRIRAGDLLIQQGDGDKAMYLVAEGSLQVFVTAARASQAVNASTGASANSAQGSKVAILRAGAIVGEPSLFGDVKRMANVEAMTPCAVWALRGPRLDEMVQRSPAIALTFMKAAAGVLAVRIAASVSQRIPVA